MENMRHSSEKVARSIRIDKGLLAVVEKIAELELRTFSAEVEYMLREYLAKYDGKYRNLLREKIKDALSDDPE